MVLKVKHVRLLRHLVEAGADPSTEGASVNNDVLSFGPDVALIGGTGAWAAPSFSFVDPVARIDYGLLGRLDNLGPQGRWAGCMTKPDVLGDVLDLRLPTPPS